MAHNIYVCIEHKRLMHGARKCEANALVRRPEEGRSLCRAAIEKYVGKDALDRFQKKRQEIVDALESFRERSGLGDTITQAIELIEEDSEES